MKKILIGIGLLISGSLAQAQGLEKIIVEKYYISDANDAAAASGGTLPAGSVTYRIYVDMLPGYTFQALYGETDAHFHPPHELRIATSTLFFNNEDRGATAANAIPKTALKSNTVMLDSWFSAGAGSAGNFGILKSADTGFITNADGLLKNTNPAAGIPLTKVDGLSAGTPQLLTVVGCEKEVMMFDAQNDGSNGPVFSTSNGSLASLNGSVGPTAANQVLIAQMTTDGTFTFELNIQIGTPSGDAEKYVARKPIDGELSIPSLTYPVNNIAPTVKVTSPVNGVTLNYNAKKDTIASITADAADQDGTVDSVAFFVNNKFVGIDKTAPYEMKWKKKLGNATILAYAWDNKGVRTISDTIKVQVSFPTGLNEASNTQPAIQIYPNPANDKVYMSIENSKQDAVSSYSIYGIAGNEVAHKVIPMTSGKHEESIDISALSPGSYILSVTINEFTSYKKIIKN